MESALRFCCAIFAGSLVFSQGWAQSSADAIYYDGTIITVNDRQPTVEALSVRGGKILAVGSTSEVFGGRSPKTRMVDLHGKTLLPGFVDGHSHIGMLALGWNVPSLAPPPVGTVQSIADIRRIMRQYIAANHIPPGEFVYGQGYDDSLLAEHRHPNRGDLDAITSDHPMCLRHISGHLATCNSSALALLHITRDTPDPQGGRIFRDPATKEATGVLGDQAAAPIAKLIKPLPFAEQEKNFLAVQNYYAAFGYTTAQEGASSDPVIHLLKQENDSGNLKIDVISYPLAQLVDGIIKAEGIHMGKAYDKHMKYPGIKIVEDGSPQGKTAYLSAPYFHPPAEFGAGYRGFPMLKQDQLNATYTNAFSKDWQVQTHCNGDACIDMVLTAIRKAYAACGADDRRPVIIHSQVVRPDQLDAYAELHIIPSFFEAHTFYWGDWHREEVLGPERAAFISPLHSALTRGIVFSIHSDAPITPPNPMLLWWAAVNRLTRSNYVLGPGERVDALTALKALTIWPAYQQFDDKVKGTLEPGKYADLVILAENPLQVSPAHIRDIRVLETIKNGGTLWKAH
jgi:predicted amidohydrolase YtcJ